MKSTNYIVVATKRFDRHLDNLDMRLNISKEEARLAIAEIKEAVRLLAELGTLPDEYGFKLHVLEKEPWVGFMEFHALDDVLVVYAELTKKRTIKLKGVYNHEMLSTGQID